MTTNARTTSSAPLALVTGASRGLGAATAAALADEGFGLLLAARDLDRLAAAAARCGHPPWLRSIAGDLADPAHRADIAAAVAAYGRLDVVVHNASDLGPSPLPALAELEPADLARTLAVNVVAPHALNRLLLGYLTAGAGIVITVSSDAAVEPYPGWGGYGASKAALDQLSRVLAVEHPGLRVYALDPGDMRTDMHQAAFPDEDISDRPLPGEIAVPALCRLAVGDLPSGRYVAAALLADQRLDTGATA